MRASVLTAVSTTLLIFGASEVQAASGSCSAFAKITGYDAEKKAITIDVDKRGSERQFFPRPEGSPNTSKLPKQCRGSALRQDSFEITPTGGRMSVTQIRENYSGKMLNDTSDESWVPTEVEKLVEAEETVVIVLRQPVGADRKDPYGVTTIYLPITEAEKKEIARLEAQAEDM